MRSHQLTTPTAIEDALRVTPTEVTLLLIEKGLDDPELQKLIVMAETQGVTVREESANDLRRMGRGRGDCQVLALVGRRVDAPLQEILSDTGLVWLLSGVSYPANAGVAIRTAEVAGAAAVVVDGPFTRKMKHLALRVAMRAHRFMPVFWENSANVIEDARNAGRQIVALEDCDSTHPWDVDLTRPTLLIAGGERDGLGADILAACDHVVSIPMPGFVGSYNVQVAVAAVAAEHLRQQHTGGS